MRVRQDLYEFASNAIKVKELVLTKTFDTTLHDMAMMEKMSVS